MVAETPRDGRNGPLPGRAGVGACDHIDRSPTTGFQSTLACHPKGVHEWREHFPTPVDVARAYGVPAVVDYGPERQGRGLLVTTGAGLLLADMDLLPNCRWAVDLGAGRHNPAARDWMRACAHRTCHLVAHVWCSITDPNWMAGVLDAYDNWPDYRRCVWAFPKPLPGIDNTISTYEELQAWRPRV